MLCTLSAFNFHGNQFNNAPSPDWSTYCSPKATSHETSILASLLSPPRSRHLSSTCALVLMFHVMDAVYPTMSDIGPPI